MTTQAPKKTTTLAEFVTPSDDTINCKMWDVVNLVVPGLVSTEGSDRPYAERAMASVITARLAYRAGLQDMLTLLNRPNGSKELAQRFVDNMAVDSRENDQLIQAALQDQAGDLIKAFEAGV